ncbi:SMP-30/gluconolactonase/LRE family protein [Cellvibrio sp. PSBB023]|uniref:SMP-30/gluconolactonase/LRE family protein n=1 Tax=Cellvibrio sp. PSBB023 TaxID=1945512 RepID=UPI00098EE978|nr:GTP-binding protein [Cellvibrio sp. PSBB023]AQT60286.1 GTP-binding protein [Cellvibrio sp. PSBB023]
MKKLFMLFSLPLCLLLGVPAQAAKQLEPLWQTADLPTPESVLYVADKKSPYLFVSLIDGQGDVVDSKGGIAKLTTEGEVIDKEWITGLNAPKGMALYKNHLYVADITELVIIDIEEEKVIEKIPVADSVFLNDVTVNSSGIVYVSDTRTNKVHRYQNGKVELYLDNVTSANGLKALGSNLVVGAGQELLLVDAKKNRLVIAKGFESGIDGIEMIERGEFIVSCWVGLVYYVHGDGRLELLIDSREEKINTADIGYDPTNKHLFVPNFFKDTVTAYQLK